MTTRSRRPSAYQPRPATLPPGTHFRRPVAEPPADAGTESESWSWSPVVTGEEPSGQLIEQSVVVAGPYDAEAPPAQPEGGPSRRARLPVLVFTAVVLVATLVAYLGWRLVGEDGQQAASVPTSAPATPTPSPTPTPASRPSATVPLVAEAPPVDPPDGGSYLEVTILESGDLDVDQWVRSSAPLSSLRLSVPADSLVGDEVVAFDLRVSADGAEAAVPPSPGAVPVLIPLAEVHQVRLTYRLSGAVLRSPSRADRALARAVALDLELNGEPRREPATISFRGATALTVICDGGGAQVRCGRRDDTDDWHVRAAAPGAGDRVMALLELPSPTAG